MTYLDQFIVMGLVVLDLSAAFIQLILVLYYYRCMTLVYGTRLLPGLNPSWQTTTSIYIYIHILKGSVLMNTVYLLESFGNLYPDPFVSLFIQVHSVKFPVQIAWNSIYILAILSCAFRSSNLADWLNYMYWTHSRSLLVISRSGLLQNSISNVMAI